MFYQNSEGKLYNLSLIRLINKRQYAGHFDIFFDGSLAETFNEELDAKRFINWLTENIKAGVNAIKFSDFA